MAKQTNYFSHDSNARNDEKLIKVRMKHKAAGYGIYFMILERLREEKNYMSIKDYNLIAFDLREDSALIKSIIEDFGLFVFTDCGKYFYSESFNERMDLKDIKSEKARTSALIKWGKISSKNANAMRTHNGRNASKESKESKGKIAAHVLESNLFRKPNPPTKQEILEHFTKQLSLTNNEAEITEMCRGFFNKYDATEWYLNGSPIKVWKALANNYISNWKKNEK